MLKTKPFEFEIQRESSWEIWDFWYPRVYGFFYRRLNNRSDVEELTSETISALLMHSHVTNPQAFIWQVARNKLCTYIKNKSKEPEFTELDGAEYLLVNYRDRIDENYEEENQFNSDEYSQNYKMKVDNLKKCITNHLKDEEYKIVYLSLIENKNSTEVGKELRLKAATVRQKLKRSIAKLKDRCVTLYPFGPLKSTILPFAPDDLISRETYEPWQPVFERDQDYVVTKASAFEAFLAGFGTIGYHQSINQFFSRVVTAVKSNLPFVIGVGVITAVLGTSYYISQMNLPKDQSIVALADPLASSSAESSTESSSQSSQSSQSSSNSSKSSSVSSRSSQSSQSSSNEQFVPVRRPVNQNNQNTVSSKPVIVSSSSKSSLPTQASSSKPAISSSSQSSSSISAPMPISLSLVTLGSGTDNCTTLTQKGTNRTCYLSRSDLNGIYTPLRDCTKVYTSELEVIPNGCLSYGSSLRIGRQHKDEHVYIIEETIPTGVYLNDPNEEFGYQRIRVYRYNLKDKTLKKSPVFSRYMWNQGPTCNINDPDTYDDYCIRNNDPYFTLTLDKVIPMNFRYLNILNTYRADAPESTDTNLISFS